MTYRLVPIDALDEEALTRLFGRRNEGAGYYRALEEAGPTQFATVADGGRTVALAPTFSITFDSAGLVRAFNPLTRLVRRRWPESGKLRIGGIGSMRASELGLAIDPALPPAERDTVFDRLLAGFEDDGNGRRDLTIVKDVYDRDAPWAHAIFTRRGYYRMPGLPGSWLELPFSSFEDYLASLTTNARRSLSRHLRDSQAIRTEVVTDIGRRSGELHALAEQTRLQAKRQFGGLEVFPPQFLDRITHEPAGARFMLHWLGERLLGFGFCQVDDRAVFGKIIGMSYPEALEHHLYFRNMLKAVELTMAEGRRWLCLGTLNYDTKLRLGARLERRWIYFKPRPAWRPTMWLVSPMFGRILLDPSVKAITDRKAWFATSPEVAPPPVQLMQGKA